MRDLLKKRWIKYSIRFLFLYCLFYYGTLAITGLSTPGRYYSSIIHQYFNFPSLFRSGLLSSTAVLLRLCGYPAKVEGVNWVRLSGAHGVRVVYGCLGIGVTSFWIAFVLANEAVIRKKVIFVLSGIAAIFLINTIRLALLVVIANKDVNAVFIQNHHLFFNIAAYVFIIVMMYIFDKTTKESFRQ